MRHFFRGTRAVSMAALFLLICASIVWGTADRRFDIATIDNTPDYSDPHFTTTNLDHLNFVTTNGHFLYVSGDTNRATIKANNNYCAAYYNNMQALFTGGYNGDQAADQIQNYWATNFSHDGLGVPQWCVINEISRGAWDANTVGPAGVAYHNWVIGMCDRLHNLYNHEVIIFSPYIQPTTNGASWTSLSNYAYIGIESHLSGAQVNAQGNSVTWCQNQYQPYPQAYHSLGVAYSRLYLTEYYGNTNATDSSGGTQYYGRAGVSYAGWDNAIKTRASAIHNIFNAGQIGGYLSYDWASNPMLVSEADQCHFEDTYASKTLP